MNYPSMKYKTRTSACKERLEKLGEIYRKASSLDEYLVEADLKDISRKNYMWMFDPLMFHYIYKTYGNWPRFAIGIGMQLICLGVISTAFMFSGMSMLDYPISVSILTLLVGLVSIAVYDIGRKIGAVYAEEQE